MYLKVIEQKYYVRRAKLYKNIKNRSNKVEKFHMNKIINFRTNQKNIHNAKIVNKNQIFGFVWYAVVQVVVDIKMLMLINILLN